ncbi:MAG: DUF1289 domain-containing protein [Ferruginibacter sp.]|nr:DUF1289 domain-containing protein [Rhodoferax sp.]
MNTIDLIASRAVSVCAGALKDAEVASPCVAICQMDAAGQLCTGCLRTLDEITVWRSLDAPGKQAVWALIVQRAQARFDGPTP